MNSIALKKLFNIALDIYSCLTNLKILYQALFFVSAQCPAILKSDLEGEPLHIFCVTELYFFVAVHKFFMWGDSSYH